MLSAGIEDVSKTEDRPDTDTAAAIKQMMLQFQGIGDNCEFGLVQRFCGAEPLGLFRFSSGSIPNLVEALDSDFRWLGSPGDLDIFAGHGDWLWCRSLRYAFTYNTNHRVGAITQDDLTRSEYKRIGYLKRRLLEDLAEGTRIFVRKGLPDESFDAFMSLATAIRRHGPSVVLRVEETADPARVGSVAWRSPGILQGYVRRFSPYEGGMRIDLEPWVELCRNAYGLATGGRPAPARTSISAPIRLPDKTDRHVTRRSPDRFTPFSIDIDPKTIVPEAITVFSAWIWIPSGFQADQVFGLVKASDVYQRLAHRDADLGLCDAWQRIWISARIPSGCSRLVVGLGVTGDPGQRFWSTDWRLGEGPVPPPAPPPSVTIRRGILDWLGR
ncbi:hypothetical protein [Methylobacterium haplocladii]|uniref:Uncharacterized protein n=1 Tax=Methylobacterium haplocladii TaxID=1176176 RepID=A0A512IMD0_9HYPH|nr:hypothetical protein [Methylobacterium haplocladii]GEO98808.1 hypothetical protein MHA02_11960 [Methylobacterium haplocladii]GJD84718.1 hypothetical protein HPGCJGGD_2600 [Methylobacterium haplocladii]GLS61288.1 hypothetical protein GCM10007887_39890 [Methylobacterium haplocladii]